MKYKRFRKLMGFIRDNTFEKGDVEGVMDLTEIEDALNELYEENEQLKEEIDELKQKEEVLNKIWRSYLENNE